MFAACRRRRSQLAVAKRLITPHHPRIVRLAAQVRNERRGAARRAARMNGQAGLPRQAGAVSGDAQPPGWIVAVVRHLSNEAMRDA
jgi:hypothetical protein